MCRVSDMNALEVFYGDLSGMQKVAGKKIRADLVVRASGLLITP